MIALQITGWIAMILVSVYYGFRRVKTEKWIKNHVPETVIRIVVGLLYAWFVFGARGINEHTMWVALFMPTSFWLIFELVLNVALKRHPLEVGSTAVTDRWFNKNYPAYIGLKAFALALFLVSLVQLLKGN